MTTKDRIIRFRAVQIAAHMINILDTLDDNLFHLLRVALLKRIHDKEASVRMHAIYGLTRLAAEVDEEEEADDSDDSDSGASGVLEKLLVLLQNDPSAEVRRSLLLNLPFTPKTLPYLLERARDQDAATRRALFARLLPNLGDFRHLSLTHREKLLRWGLRDRDDTVRKATARLFRERWIEDCAALPAAGEAEDREDQKEGKKGAKQAADPSLDALLELLERIDVTNSAANGVAIEAMKEFWDGRPDYLSYITFDDAYWAELTPESVFVARTFNDYCRGPASEKDGRLADIVESKMPEVTKFGFLLERQIKGLVDVIREAASDGPDGDGDEEAEEESVSREFVVEQMLTMALTFDYSDEVGRRKMFSLLRDALTMPELPEEATKLVAEVLRLVCGDDSAGKGEREFCGIVLEAIAEVHDTIMGDEGDKSKDDNTEDSFHSAKSELSEGNPARSRSQKKDADGDTSMDGDVNEEKAIREIMVNMKCLHIAQCMLQNVQCDLEENVHLVTMLNNLVVPAVRSQEAPIRERGLVCLGLCCLLGKNLAQENLTLFLHCFAKGHPALQTIALQIMTDILTTHPTLLSSVPSENEGDTTQATTTMEASPLLKPVLKAFMKALKSEDASVQSVGATALSKLMLGQLITDVDLLKQLIITFFDPETAANAQLRQGLSYFLPVYCHSRQENAERMVQVATGVISRLGTLREAFVDDEDADEGEMVTLTVVGGLLVDWTDPRKIVGAREHEAISTGRYKLDEGDANKEGSTHLMLAEQILERLVTSQTSSKYNHFETHINANSKIEDERKVLFTMLSKLHLAASGPDVELLKTVLELTAEAIDTRVATDATSRNALAKLQTVLLKTVHDTATAERGGEEETLADDTALTTPGRRRQTQAKSYDEDDQEDEATMQLRRELEQTQIEDPDADSTHIAAIGDETEGGATADGVDTSQLPDESELQSLIDSIGDENDDDLLL